MSRRFAFARGPSRSGAVRNSDHLQRAATSVVLDALESRQLLSGYAAEGEPLISPAPYLTDDYGAAIATRGNLMLVGAPMKQVNGFVAAGEAYLVNRDTGEFKTLQRPSDDIESDEIFGRSVTFVGQNVLIGAPGSIVGTSAKVGKAYLFSPTGTLLQTYIPNSNSARQFGLAVAAYQDAQPMIYSIDAVVAGTIQGVVRVYNDSSLDRVILDSKMTDDAFGRAMAVDGSRVLIGSPQRGGVGAAYYYSDLSQTAGTAFGAPIVDIDSATPLTLPSPTEPQARFGQAVAFAGSQLVVGAPGTTVVFEDGTSPAPNSGSVHLFSNAGISQAVISSPSIAGEFGTALALDGNHLVVGAPEERALAGDDSLFVGAAYVFNLTNPPVLTQTLRTHRETLTSQRYGTVIAVVRHSSTHNDILIGVPGAGSGEIDAYAGLVTAPLVANAGPDQEALRDQAITLSGSGSGDTITRYEWDLNNDGTFETTGQTITVSFATTGVRKINFRVTDDDTPAETAVDSLFVNVTEAYVDASGNLMVGGSSSAETIEVRAGSTASTTTLQVQSGTVVDVFINGTLVASESPTNRVIIRGGAGDDDITVHHSLEISVDLLGGDGNDVLRGGSLSDLLNGGNGNDTLQGRGGGDIVLGGAGDDLVHGGDSRDLLIGGTGADRIIGHSDDDILIAGATIHDQNRNALDAILAEWSSSRSYSERVANLGGGSGASSTRTNGNFFLNQTTVFDDGARDILTGSAGQDWAHSHSNDKTTDLRDGELASDVELLGIE